MTEKETEGERGGGERRERKKTCQSHVPTKQLKTIKSNQNIQYWTNPMSQT